MSNFNVLLWIEDRDYYSIEGILVMNGPFFDLCAMSKFVHYAKYSHDPIDREKKEGTRAKLTSLSLSICYEWKTPLLGTLFHSTMGQN